jgi:hypothetical protein
MRKVFRYSHHVACASPPCWLHRTLPAQPAPNPPAGDNWIHEIKLDGFRMMVRRDTASVRLLTRKWMCRLAAGAD